MSLAQKVDRSPAPCLLFIAYGNSLRRDDGAGLALAEKISPLLRRQGFRVKMITVQQLMPELALAIADEEVNALYFFDTTVEVGAAGIQVQPIEPVDRKPVLGHHLTPAILLLYAAHLYGHCPPGWLITIPGSDFALGEGLSPTTAAHLAYVDPLARQLGELAPVETG